MQSHAYQFQAADLARTIFPVAGALLLIVALLRGADALGLLPPEPETLHADETVLRYQAAASARHNPAALVLVGDSTCHAAVDAAQLSQQLPTAGPAINLALIISLHMGWYAQSVADFNQANPGQVRWAVLLVSPTRLITEGEHEPWESLRRQARGDSPRPETRVRDPLGLRLVRHRLASRVLPAALRGKGAGTFGFTTDLWRYMEAHRGSIVDFGEYTPRRRKPEPVWPEPAEFRAELDAFRNRLPGEVRLAVGLTPVPAGTAGPDAPARYLACLTAMQARLQADLVLSNLPPTLPTSCFAPGGHMNSLGQRVYTTVLAEALQRGIASHPINRPPTRHLP